MKRDIKKIVAGIIASLIITSNNTVAIFASNSEYLDDAANAYIEQIKDQDTLTKTKSILSYASKMDGTTENCVTAALNVYNLCEAAGIRCHVRTSANSDSFGAQNHVNNVIDVDGTSYIADVSMGSKHIIFFKATEYKYFYKDTGFSDGNFVYRTGSDGNYIVSECLKWDYSDVVIPTQTVNPLTGETVKVTAVEQTEFVDSNAVRSVTIPDEIVTLRERAFYCLANLKSVTLNSNIISIPDYCFYGCESLTDVNLENILNYGSSCFERTLIETVQPNSKATFADATFCHMPKLRSVVLPDGITTLTEAMFSICPSLTSIVIPSSVTTFKKSVFYNCNNLVVTIPDTVTTLGASSLNGTKMVYCTSNSACAKYCEENGVKYKLTDVAPPNANDFEVTLSEDSFVYSGYEEKPENVTVYYKGKELWGASPYVDNPDYSVQYTNNINAGTASVVITGMGDYIGTKVVNYTINPLALTSKSSRINFADGSMGQYKFTGSEIKPKINVFKSDDDTRLTEGKDYKVSYSDNINAGTGTIKVTFMGNYTGSISKTFKITPAHQHTFGSWRITKAPTCTADGEQARSCTSKDCGYYTETKTIPATGHSYKITSEADPCTGGKVTYTCSNCGDSYTEDVAAQGHKYVDTVVAPTCTTGGYTLHTCSVCKKSYKDNETQPTGHKYITNTVEATCETDGYTEKKCSNCDYYTKTIIPKKGHTPSSEWTVIKQTTCAEAGEQVRYCTICGKVTEKKDISKLAHTPADEWTVIKQPTCSEIGEQVRYCTICGNVAEKQEITKLPHTPSDWIIDKEAAPGIAGSTHTECTVCHTKLETATIPAKSYINIANASITLSQYEYNYDGSRKTPSVTVTSPEGTTLINGKDYTITYSNNINIGNATVKITGIGYYTSSKTVKFTIKTAKKVNLSSASVKLSTSTYAYNGKTKKPAATVIFNGSKLVKDKDFSVSYSNNKNVGTATVTIKGKGNYTGSIKKTFKIKNNFKKSVVTGIKTKSFTGKSITQKPTIKFNKKTLKNGTDYTISYSNNKKVGLATIKITGKGNYTGTITKTFKINPAKQNIQKLRSKSRSFFIDWAQKGSATGYEIQYATNSKFSGAKKVTVTNNKTDKKTISKLSGKKKYYVRVRSYTTVKGKKYYGAWSSTKSVTTKK